MSSPSDPSRSNDSLISEDVLLDWVEGRLTPQQAADLAARSGRAGLAERVAQMQADRSTLRALPTFKAPPVLMDRVLAALERESLVGIASGTPVQDHPPISLTEYKAARAARSKWPMRMAVAAGLTLLVGSAGFLALRTFAPVGGTSSGPIAFHSVEQPSGPDPAETLAAATPPAPGATPELNAISTGADSTLPAEAKVAAAVPAEPIIIDSARAAELAREGRLVVRVGPAKANSVETLAAKDRSWRMSKTIPAAMTVAVAKVASDRSRLSPSVMADARENPQARAERQARIVESLAPMIGPGAAQSFMATPTPSIAPAAYICETTDSPEAIESLKAALESRLKADVLFEELAEPLPPPAPEDASDVLWWTKGSSAWSPKVSVPVLIDRK